MNFKFSNQAVGAIMMALQKGIMEQSDITNMLKDFDIVNSVDGLVVNNPPAINLQENANEDVATVKTPRAQKSSTKKKTTRKKTTKKKTTRKKVSSKKIKENA